MNIYFGIQDYWKINILTDISKQLKEKRIIQKKADLLRQAGGCPPDPEQKKCRDVNEKIVDKAKRLQSGELLSKPEPCLVFIQFQSMNSKSKFTKALNINICKRAFLICICRKNRIAHKYLNGNIWPKIYAAPEPTLIIWDNIGVGKLQHYLRILLVNLISLLVLVCGFFCISYGKQYTEKKELSSSPIGDFDPE